MAKKRMFDKSIVDSDAFLDMSLSSQALYFHLNMRADDEGFINNPKRIMRLIGCNEDDLKMLIIKKFVIPFDSGIVVIKHWKINNYLRNDRKVATLYAQERSQICEKKSGAYELINKSDNKHGIPNVNQMSTCGIHSIEENRIEENSINTYAHQKNAQSQFDALFAFDEFWKAYPKKKDKKKAQDKFLRCCKDEFIFNQIMFNLSKQKRSRDWNKSNGQFIPYPTTWLNGERWNDEVEVEEEKPF